MESLLCFRVEAHDRSPDLPITHLPVQVQLTNTTGACWAASYGSTLKNQAGTFKAKSD